MGHDDYNNYQDEPCYSLTCCECNANHGIAPSGFNKWHVCKNCRAAYCPEHGGRLPHSGMLSYGSGKRICRCGGETRLV